MQKFTKKVITFLLAITMIVGLATPAMATRHNFTDVRDGQWYSEGIQFVFANGIMEGVGGNQFAPNRNLTRAEVSALIFRFHHGRVANANDSTSNHFNDVGSAWYAPYITWVNNNNIDNGIEQNQFGPNRHATRQEFAAMMYRYAMSLRGSTDRGQQSQQWNQFTDRSQIASWAYAPLRWMNYHGIIQGRTSTTINPEGTLTRAEAATIFMRFMTVLPSGALPTLPDRRLTEQERTEWIAAYRALGGPTDVELEIAQRISEIRVEHGLSPVQVDETLMMAARFYAQTMSQWGQLGHNVGPYATDPAAGHGASVNIARAFGGDLGMWLGGNAGSGPSSLIVQMWMISEGHRAYILSPEHQIVGVGIYNGFTYLFLGIR